MTSLWPDEAQLLLLTAALGDGQDAVDAFDRWQQNIDFADHLDQASFRLLPQLHHNLKRLHHTDPLMIRFAGVFRYTWVSVQKLHDDTARLLDLCAAAQIPMMLNKGMALGICHYDNPAHRPMSDVDIMVPRDRVMETAAILKGAGWQVLHAGRENINWRDIIDYRHSVGFRDPDGNEMDLHWAPSSELRGEVVERVFWTDAQPMKVRGRNALRPSATCMLLHTALHGVRYNEMPPLRWIADFHMILRKEREQVDWNLLVALAIETRTSTRLAMALNYLQENMGTDIPANVMIALKRERPGITERIENWSALIDPGKSRFHRAISDRRIAGIAQVLLDSKGIRLPGMAVRWLAREGSNLIARRNAPVG
jgi:hypothetical protein